MFAYRIVFEVLVLAVVARGCVPPCEEVPSPSVCTPNGPIVQGVPFSVRATPEVAGGTCEVIVDGGQLEFVLTGSTCANGGPALKPVDCAVPALAAGTYSVKDTTVTFAVPEETDDAGFPRCP